MRKQMEFCMVDGEGNVLTQVYRWSVEGMVKDIRENSADPLKVDLANKLLIYGDSVTAYDGT